MDKSGNPIVIIDDESPNGLKRLAEFIRRVNIEGLNMKPLNSPELTEEIANTDFLSFDNDIITVPEEVNDEGEVVRLAETGNTTYTENQVASIFDQLVNIVNQHNQYILNVPPQKKASMAKNQALWGIWKVASDPTNIEEGMIGIDQATKLPKDLAANSISAEHDLEAAAGNVFTKHSGIVEGQVGKNCVSIGAVAIKVNAFTQLYYNLVLNQDDETIKPCLISNPQQIAGQTIITIDNIFDQTTELSEDGKSLQQNPDIKRMIDSLAEKYAWALDSNSSIQMAALLSIAVDNAKDLALAKLNAGPTMIGLYDYGLLCGVPLEHLEAIINSPAGRMVAELTLDNSFNEDPSERNAVGALAFLEGRIGKYLKQWNKPVKNAQQKWISITPTFRGADEFALWYLKETLEESKLRDLMTAVAKYINQNPNIKASNYKSDVSRINLLFTNKGLQGFLATVSTNSSIKSIEPILTKLNKGLNTSQNREIITTIRKNGITQSDALGHLLRPYYLKYCIDTGTKAEDSLSSMISTLAKFGDLDQILTKISETKEYKDLQKNYEENAKQAVDGNLEAQSKAYDNMAWFSSFKSLEEWVRAYNQKVKLFNNSTVKLPNGTVVKVKDNLWNLAEGGEEMRVIGVICSSNKALKTKQEEALNFQKTIEECIINRIEIIKSRYPENKKLQDLKTDKYKIDFIQFMLDPEYRRQMYIAYQTDIIPGIAPKVRTNPLHMIEVDPHLFKYVEANIIPTAVLNQMSCKFRATQKYSDSEYTDLFEVRGLNETKSYLTSLDRLLNAKLLIRWLSSTNKTFILPAGNRYFVEDVAGNIVLDHIAETDIPIKLGSLAGLATFKRYMELDVIPRLKRNNGMLHNKFVENLIPIKYSKTASKTPSQVYTLDVNMMPKKDSPEEAKLLDYMADFDELRTFDFNQFSASQGSIGNMQEAFYIYSMYVFNGRKSPQSLMKLFDKKSRLVDEYNEFLAKVDASGSIELSQDELVAWCAPLRSQHSTLGEYAYVYNDQDLGPALSAKIDYSESKASNDPTDVGASLEQDAALEALDQDEGSSYKRRPNWRPLSKQQNKDFSAQLAGQYFIYPNASIDSANIVFDVNSSNDQVGLTVEVDPFTGKVLYVSGIYNQTGQFVDTELIERIKSATIIKPAIVPGAFGIGMQLDEKGIRDIIDLYESEKNKECNS